MSRPPRTTRGVNGILDIAAVGVDYAHLPGLQSTAPRTPAGGTGPGVPEGAETTLRPGDDALLMIRPAGVVLLRSAENRPHLTGRAADVAFRGRGYEYAIDLPGLGRLTSVFAGHRIDRGEAVGLRPNPRACHLFAVVANHAESEASPSSVPLEV